MPMSRFAPKFATKIERTKSPHHDSLEIEQATREASVEARGNFVGLTHGRSYFAASRAMSVHM